MNWSLFIAICLCSLLIVYINIYESVGKYKKWIKEGELIQCIPTWRATKKPLIWYIIWVVVDWLSLPCFIILAILGKTATVIVAPLFLVACYFVLIHIAYGIGFYIMRKRINKKEKNK